ncbi:MAG: hypothetical protein MZU95_13940 [Desulfomicrobium escambiense]|nr:hypothetical protein [Desulfomicrobium escambiense]
MTHGTSGPRRTRSDRLRAGARIPVVLGCQPRTSVLSAPPSPSAVRSSVQEERSEPAAVAGLEESYCRPHHTPRSRQALNRVILVPAK